MKRWVKVLFFFLLLLSISVVFFWKFYVFFITSDQMAEAAMDPIKMESEPPFFNLKNQSGNFFSLNDYKGKFLFLNFWATWCEPCKEEMVSMNTLYNHFKTKKLEMVAISVDESWDPVNRYLVDKNFNFEIILDKQGKTPKDFGTNKFPETYIISPEGKIINKFVGPRNWFSKYAITYFDNLLTSN